MSTYLHVAQMLISIALIVVILLQVRGGGLGGIFGQPDSVYRTRRDVEKALFQFTIAFAVIFIIISIVSVKMAS